MNTISRFTAKFLIIQNVCVNTFVLTLLSSPNIKRIFIGGILGLAYVPGELKTKAIGAGGGMAISGLLVKGAEKAFGIV